MKVVRSDTGDEYYGKHDEMGQCPSPFVKLLERHDFCALYTMSYTPHTTTKWCDRKA